MGNEEDRQFCGQHDVRWVENSEFGTNHFSLFNNGVGRPESNYSTIDFVIPSVDNLGNYLFSDNSIFLPVGKNIKTAVNPNISGGSIGGGGNDDIKDILTKLNAVDENKYNTTKTDHKSKVLTEIKTFNSKTVNDEKQLTLLFNNLLTYFQQLKNSIYTSYCVKK